MPHDVAKVIKDYVDTYGKRLNLPPFDPTPSKLTVDPALSLRAGRAFDAMKHEPTSPPVAAAYDELKKELLLQFAHMVKHGVKTQAWREPGQPYANSKEMAKDVRDNAHLWYFPTDSGFGEGDAFADHPLYERVPGTDVRYNDLLRVVHDYFAHALHGHQFGPQGELRAWHEHTKTLSPLARKALSTETHGQNSWVNFGPHEPWKLHMTKRPYADQKAGLLPEDVWPDVPETKVTNREPPVKLARRKGEPRPSMSGHDQLLKATGYAHATTEYTPMALLADKLDETGRSGGDLLRHSHNELVIGADPRPRAVYSAWIDDHDSLHGVTSPDKAYTVRLNAVAPPGTPVPIPDSARVVLQPSLEITHWPEDMDRPATRWFTHHITLRSAEHMREVLGMLPPNIAHWVGRHMVALARASRQTQPGSTNTQTQLGYPGPKKLARTRVDSTGSAMASAGSTNHEAKLKVVRNILRDSGLTPAVVRSAITHGTDGAKPGFATVINRPAHPDHVRYTAAWLGLVTGNSRIAVAQPDPDGRDFLHVINVIGAPDHINAALKAAGVPRFTTERTATGARVFVLNPNGRYPVEKVARANNAGHSVGRVRVYRLGAGASSDAPGGKPASTAADARAGFRSVIDDFERAGGSAAKA